MMHDLNNQHSTTNIQYRSLSPKLLRQGHKNGVGNWVFLSEALSVGYS